MLLVPKFMGIRIFYAVCGLSVLFFAAFFIQCCRAASRKNKHVIRELSVDDIFTSAQTTHQLAQWEEEMAEFMARQGRSTALLFLMAAGSVALLRSALPPTRAASMIAQADSCASVVADQNASLNLSQAEPTPCQKN